MNTIVMCIVEQQKNAEAIVQRLRNAGILSSNVSVLFPNAGSTTTFAATNATMAPEGAVVGAGTGALIGGELGLALGLGALFIPGLGPFLAAGPLLIALSGAIAGTAFGGLAGALVGLGLPETDAKRYETRVRGGHIFVSMHASSADEARRAAHIFRSEGADEIYSTPEPEAPRMEHVPHAGI